MASKSKMRKGGTKEMIEAAFPQEARTAMLTMMISLQSMPQLAEAFEHVDNLIRNGEPVPTDLWEAVADPILRMFVQRADRTQEGIKMLKQNVMLSWIKNHPMAATTLRADTQQRWSERAHEVFEPIFARIAQDAIDAFNIQVEKARKEALKRRAPRAANDNEEE